MLELLAKKIDKTNESILKYYQKSPFSACFEHFFPQKGQKGHFPEKEKFCPVLSPYNTLTFCEEITKQVR